MLLAPAVRLCVCISDDTLPLVDAGFPDEVKIVGKGRDVKSGEGTAAEAGAVRSNSKIYQGIVRLKRYTQTHNSSVLVAVD